MFQNLNTIQSVKNVFRDTIRRSIFISFEAFKKREVKL